MKTPAQEPGIIEAIFIMGGFAVITALSVCQDNNLSPSNPARDADRNPAGMLERSVCNSGMLAEKEGGMTSPSTPWDPEAGSPTAVNERAVHHG